MRALNQLIEPVFGQVYTAGPNGFWVFVVLTLGLCGLAAYVTGRAIAETWRPFWQVVLYAALLACVSRFLHFALFHEVMLSLGNYIVDFAILFGLSALGFSRARATQMATQYSWPKAAG
jgi:hypothetical protein